MTTKRFILVQSDPTDQQYDWYVIDVLVKACVGRVSGGFAFNSDVVDRMNREAS